MLEHEIKRYVFRVYEKTEVVVRQGGLTEEHGVIHWCDRVGSGITEEHAVIHWCDRVGSGSTEEHGVIHWCDRVGSVDSRELS